METRGELKVMAKLFKVLLIGKNCEQNKKVIAYSLPKGRVAGKWMPPVKDPTVSERGYHLTTQPYNWWHWGCDVYEAQGAGESDTAVAASVIAFERVRLLKRVRQPAWLCEAERFVQSIKNVPFFKPDGKPLKEWKVFRAKTWNEAESTAAKTWNEAESTAKSAANDATKNSILDTAWFAARNAARNAAGDAARTSTKLEITTVVNNEVKNAAWDAVSNEAESAAWDAIKSAVSNEVKSAAWDAVMSVVSNEAESAARDAMLLVQCLIVKDAVLLAQCLIVKDKLAPEYLHHARARWKVWQKGYVLLCDVKGILYVYAQED